MPEITVKDILKVAQAKRNGIRNICREYEKELAELEDKKKRLTVQDLSDMSAYEYRRMLQDIELFKKYHSEYVQIEKGAQEITDALIEFIIENGLYEAVVKK